MQGEISIMTDSKRRSLLESAEQMANKALRVIAVGYKDISAGQLGTIEASEANLDGVYPYENSGICFLGFFGIMDVLREDVLSSVLKCQAAGIKVRMITGDSKLTAIAIAKKCGILSSEENLNGKVMEGKEFMERIEGVVCSYCRTAKCGCATTTINEEQSPESKPQKSPQADTESKSGKTSKSEGSLIVHKGGLKGNLKSTKNTKISKKGDYGTKQVKFKEENEIFDQQTSKESKKKPSEPPKQRTRVDTIKNQKEFDLIIPQLAVLARSRPQDKYAMIVGLKNRDSIVAVTGDGTNDAPALSKADVGFAMGNSGTDLAKNAADIIITNDNFSSIVSAIVRGRNIYDSIRKFLMFQLTVNVVAVVGTFLGAIFFNNAIISAIQMLWINLIMDTLASLALATEPPIAKDLLKRKPYPKQDHILSRKMLKHIIGQALLQLSVLAIVIFNGKLMFEEVNVSIIDKGRLLMKLESDQSRDATFHFTYIFNVFVWLQIFNFLNCRRLYDEFNIFKGLTKSKIFLLIWLLIVGLQILIVNFGGKAFNLVFMVFTVNPGDRPQRLGNLYSFGSDHPSCLRSHQAGQGGRLFLLLQEDRSDVEPCFIAALVI
jgi:magnesium-transporting ATPase (P-type)